MMIAEKHMEILFCHKTEKKKIFFWPSTIVSIKFKDGIKNHILN